MSQKACGSSSSNAVRRSFRMFYLPLKNNSAPLCASKIYDSSRLSSKSFHKKEQLTWGILFYFRTRKPERAKLLLLNIHET